MPRLNFLKQILIVGQRVAIDVETTGCSALYDKILEIAAVRYCPEGRILGCFSTTITPSKDSPAFAKAIPEFFKFIGKTPVIGHNVQFDLRFLNHANYALNLPSYKNEAIDTLALSRRIEPESPSHKLSSLIEHLKLHDKILADFKLLAKDKIEAAVSHRALYDAIASYKLYTHCLNEIQNRTKLEEPSLFFLKNLAKTKTAKIEDVNKLLIPAEVSGSYEYAINTQEIRKKPKDKKL